MSQYRLIMPIGLLVLAGIALGPGVLAGEIPLADEATLGPVSFATARAIRFADIDGDGDLDVVAAQQTAGTIIWLENTAGDGSAFTAHTIDDDFGNVIFVAVADVDGNGTLDIVGSRLSTDVGEDSVVWYSNDGTPGNDTAWEKNPVAQGLALPREVAVGDLDLDGDLDIVVAHNGQNVMGLGDEVLWYESVPIGGNLTWTEHTIDGAIPTPVSVVIGDINGDGLPDVVATSFGGGSVFWYANDGNPAATSEWTKETVDGAFSGAVNVDLADVDHDGDLDIAGAGVTENEVAVWLNTGATPWPRVTVEANFVEAQAVAFADLDQDGDMDLIGGTDDAPAPVNDSLRWWENVGGTGMTWTPRSIVDGALDRVTSVAAGDLDGDGDPDIAAAEFGDGELIWFQNESIHRIAAFTSVTSISSAQASDVAFEDVDGDGDVDVIGAFMSDGALRWFSNTGNAFGGAQGIASLSGATSVAAADMDRDGAVDVVGAAEAGNALNFYRNANGLGTSWTATVIDNSLGNPAGIAIGDIDLDGFPDVVSVGSASGVVNWYENQLDTGGGFQPQSINSGFTGATDILVADVNNDGFFDVVAASSTLGDVRWWENDGTPETAAWTENTIDDAIPGVSALAVVTPADNFQGLGFAILAATPDTGQVFAYERGPGTTFTKSEVAQFSGPEALLAADLNADGSAGLLVADAAAARLVHDGTVVLEGEFPPAGTANGIEAIALADANLDGKLDVAGAGTMGLRFWPDQGGNFALATTALDTGSADDGVTLAALQIDASHAGRAGDADVELVSLDFQFVDNGGAELTSAQANALIDTFSIVLDDGSGQFEAGMDTVVASTSDLSLTDGVQSVSFADGDAGVQLAPGQTRTYFAVVTITADASMQSPDNFRVIHLTEGTPAGEDASNGLPLQPTRVPDVQSELIALGGNPADINRDGNVNAVDVQLVINAALGLPINPFDDNADVNNSGGVNAVDVQLVINAALGL